VVQQLLIVELVVKPERALMESVWLLKLHQNLKNVATNIARVRHRAAQRLTSAVQPIQHAELDASPRKVLLASVPSKYKEMDLDNNETINRRNCYL